MTADPRELLARYASGRLTAAEEARLHRAALDDQELFDELVAEQAVRDALDLPGARERVRALLEGSPARRPARFRWVLPTLAAAALVATLGVRVFVERGTERGAPSRVEEPSPAPPEPPRARSLTVPPPEPTVAPGADAVLVLNKPGPRPEYAIGEPFKLGVRVARRVAVYLEEVPATGVPRRLYPPEGAIELPAGAELVLPPPGAPALAVQGPAGPRTIRLRTGDSGALLAEVTLTVY